MYTLQHFVKKGMLALFVAGSMTACKQQGAPAATTAPAAGAATPATSNNGVKIAYVDLDTLESHFDYFIQRKGELEKKRDQMDNELKANARALQAKVAAFQQKANTLSQAEGESIQRSLMTEQQELEQKRQDMGQQYSAQEGQFNDELQKKLDAYLKIYNADKRYTYIFSFRTGQSNILYHDESCDITADVIKGINQVK